MAIDFLNREHVGSKSCRGGCKRVGVGRFEVALRIWGAHEGETVQGVESRDA
jgi:hypothetical protein